MGEGKSILFHQNAKESDLKWEILWHEGLKFWRFYHLKTLLKFHRFVIWINQFSDWIVISVQIEVSFQIWLSAQICLLAGNGLISRIRMKVRFWISWIGLGNSKLFLQIYHYCFLRWTRGLFSFGPEVQFALRKGLRKSPRGVGLLNE